MLDHLLGDAERIAIVDVETTGLYRSDRIVEIAIVTIDRSGVVIDEFETLVNPFRDVGPTWLHGVTSSMVVAAPSFDRVAHHVASRLDGAIVAAHNLPFDCRMVGVEFELAGISIDWGDGIDTLSATGCKLQVACMEHGIQHGGPHRALDDARATAQLLVAVADEIAGCGSAAMARPLDVHTLQILTRDGQQSAQPPLPYLVDLAQGVHSPVDVAAYVDLLDVALADLRLTDDERSALAGLSLDLGLDPVRVARAHRDFLEALIDGALDDGVVTDEEYDHLCRAAALLEIDVDVVHMRTDGYRTSTALLDPLPGLTVCFTGTVIDVDGREIPRAIVEEWASEHDLVPVRSVTATGCDVLVAADLSSVSGKAEKARRYGVPIASVQEFAAGVEGRTSVSVTRLARSGVALVCGQCGDSWLAARRSSRPICAACRRAPRPSSPASREPDVILPGNEEDLICLECGATWSRERVRGRKPHRCPACIAIRAHSAGLG